MPNLKPNGGEGRAFLFTGQTEGGAGRISAGAAARNRHAAAQKFPLNSKGEGKPVKFGGGSAARIDRPAGKSAGICTVYGRSKPAGREAPLIHSENKRGHRAGVILQKTLCEFYKGV